MSVLTIGILGIAGALLAVELKGLKGEYGIYLVAAVGLVIFFYGVTKLKTVIETIRQVQSYIRLNRMYLEVLLKMIGSASSFPDAWGNRPIHRSVSQDHFVGFHDSRRQSLTAHPPRPLSFPDGMRFHWRSGGSDHAAEWFFHIWVVRLIACEKFHD